MVWTCGSPTGCWIDVYKRQVADTAQVQNWNVTVLTLRGILTLAAGMVGGTVVIILLLFAGITLAGRRKKEDRCV